MSEALQRVDVLVVVGGNVVDIIMMTVFRSRAGAVHSEPVSSEDSHSNLSLSPLCRSQHLKHTAYPPQGCKYQWLDIPYFARASRMCRGGGERVGEGEKVTGTAVVTSVVIVNTAPEALRSLASMVYEVAVTSVGVVIVL